MLSTPSVFFGATLSVSTKEGKERQSPKQNPALLLSVPALIIPIPHPIFSGRPRQRFVGLPLVGGVFSGWIVLTGS